LVQMLSNISFDIYPEIYSHSPDISRDKFWLIACHQFQNPKLILTHINPSILTSIVAVTMTWSYFDMTANMLSGIAKKRRGQAQNLQACYQRTKTSIAYTNQQGLTWQVGPDGDFAAIAARSGETNLT
jgi:hypothetical protein